MKDKRRVSFARIIIFLFVVISIIGLIEYLFPVMKNLSTHEGQVPFKEKINNSRIWGFLILLGLQFA